MRKRGAAPRLTPRGRPSRSQNQPGSLESHTNHPWQPCRHPVHSLSLWERVRVTYDAYGNQLTESRWNSYGTSTTLANADARTTTFQYDATYHAFKIKETTAPTPNVPAGLVTSYAFDYVKGRLTGVTDPNNQTTTHQYDALSRRIATWLPGDDTSKLGAATVLYAYQIGMNLPTRIQTARRKDAGGTLFARRSFTWQFYDGFGRVIQTQTDFDRSSKQIHAQDINDVITAVQGDGGSLSLAHVTAGTDLVRAIHFTQIAGSIGGLWSGKSLGDLPTWSSGVTPSGPPSATPIYGSDIVDLRQWLNAYEAAVPKTITNWTNFAGSVVAQNRFYDNRGKLQAESAPFSLSTKVPGQFANWTTGASPGTSYTYDALKRPLTRVQPDGQATYHWSYTNFQTTTTDENGHQKTSTTDVLGRTVQVQEKVNGAWSTTSYGYDVADRLVKVTDAQSNQTTISYDSLGRKLGMSDPDLGANWTYAYPANPTATNPLWLVQSQTDARGQTISYQYDALDRLTSKSGTNLAVSYGYDDQSSGNKGVGRKTSMSDGAGSVSYSYDARGRLTSLSRTITGYPAYQIQTSYDAQDRPLTITFPNGDVLTYNYGDHGKAVSLALNSSTLLVQNATYNALGKVTALPLGNGLQTVWKYFGIDQQASVPNRWYGLPYQVQTGSLQNQTFGTSNGYDLVGNPTSLSYADHASESLSFAYNELDQLLSMSGSASESYGSYLQGSADIGNLLSSREGSYSYPAAGQAHPHSPNSVSSVGSYSYDGNGNRQSDPTYGYTYDVENHLTQLTQGGSTVLQNTFDGDGNRLVRVAGGTTTHYIGEWYEFNPTTSVATVYYPFNGQAIAMKQGSTLSYLHRDQVGSVVSISDASGAEVGSARYWPFGGARQTTGSLPTDRLFTGQIRDLGDDRFYFFKARYYDATIGKFLVPDSIVPNAGNPQSLNRYAYALNNPLRYIDPSGHLTQDQIDGYLKQQYGKDWQVHLQQWEANKDWWAAITRAKPGDYLRSSGQYGRLTALGADDYSLTFDNGARQAPLSSWSGSDVDLVLHQQASNVWQATWTKPAPPDDIPLLLDTIALALAFQAGTFLVFAAVVAPIPIVGDALAAIAIDGFATFSLASGIVGVVSAGYSLATGGLVVSGHRVWLSEGAAVSVLTAAGGIQPWGKSLAFSTGLLQEGADAVTGSSNPQTYFSTALP